MATVKMAIVLGAVAAMIFAMFWPKIKGKLPRLKIGEEAEE